MKSTINVFRPLTWDVSQSVVNILFWIVSACVLHQSCKHRLFSNALHATIIIVVIKKLFLLVSNIKKYICDVLNSSLSFLTKYEKKNLHNMLPLMLNLRLSFSFFIVYSSSLSI